MKELRKAEAEEWKKVKEKHMSENVNLKYLDRVIA